MCKHVVYICDDNYAMPTLVSMLSLKESIKSKCRVHIITVGLSESSKMRFLDLQNESFSVDIIGVDTSKYEEKLNRINQRTHVTPSALLKFEICTILKEVNVALYLDSDIIVKGNIEGIFSTFETEQQDYFAASVPELWRAMHKNEKEYEGFYFNSGVMLLNLKLMREHGIPDRLWDEKFKISQDKTKKTMDQDTLNAVFEGCAKQVDIIYNFNPYFANQKFLSIINSFSSQKYEKMDEVLQDVRIIHYVGKEDKPWIYSSARMGQYWDKYFTMTGLGLESLHRKIFEKNIKYKVTILERYIRKYGIKKAFIKIINKVF